MDTSTGQILWQIDLEDATQLFGAGPVADRLRPAALLDRAGQPVRGHLGHVWPNGGKLGYGHGVLAAGSVLADSGTLRFRPADRRVEEG